MKMKSGGSDKLETAGEFAYSEALESVPDGNITYELILEPDNPYDHRAISVRHNDRVLTYIARDETRKYWQSLAKVTASGYMPVIDGHFEKEFTSICIHLPPGTASLPEQFRDMKPVKASQLPPTYREPERRNR
ncbi:hypothetical protein AALI21_02930 [Corynebacteriaceae bacterium 6-324]